MHWKILFLVKIDFFFLLRKLKIKKKKGIYTGLDSLDWKKVEGTIVSKQAKKHITGKYLPRTVKKKTKKNKKKKQKKTKKKTKKKRIYQLNILLM